MIIIMIMIMIIIMIIMITIIEITYVRKSRFFTTFRVNFTVNFETL